MAEVVCLADGVAPGEAAAFADLVLRNEINRVLLERLAGAGLPDWWLVAGCLFQTVWNIRGGRPPGENISDYDVFYYDGTDLSWEAEDREIRRLAARVADVPARVELRNQARVHLWYAERFGPGYPALRSSRDGIDRFLVDCTRVAIRMDADRRIALYAPSGLADLHAGLLRSNPMNARPERFHAKAESYRARWPWLRVVE